MGIKGKRVQQSDKGPDYHYVANQKQRSWIAEEHLREQNSYLEAPEQRKLKRNWVKE